MDIHKGIEVLKKHAKEELRIHEAILKEAKKDIKHLVRKHLEDTVTIHKTFYKDLRKAVKSKS